MRAANGFTLIEVMIALTILTIVLLGMASMTTRTVHVTTVSDREEAAIQLAQDKLDFVRSDPRYLELDSVYGGVETNCPTLPGVQRSTLMNRVTTANNDYTKVTVTITGPGLSQPVARSITVARP